MRRVIPLTLALASLLVGACTMDGRFLPLDRWTGTPSPTPSGPCEIVGVVPAAMFAVGLTSPASAGATVSLEPWVLLHAPVFKYDEPLPETFQATVDAAAREIVVSGRMRTIQPNPGAACAYPMMYAIPKVATLSVPVVLTATGTYTVRIASESYAPPYPNELLNPNQPDKVYPEPMATRSLVID